MNRLADGTPINLTEEGSRFFANHTDASIIKIHNYRSKSSGNVATLSIRLRYNFEDSIRHAMQVVRDKPLDPNFSSEIWEEARSKILASLSESLLGNHSKDTSSASSQPLDAKIPGISVGLSTGNIQIRGLLDTYTLHEKGESKPPRKSKPLTLAKRALEKGTYREKNQSGSFITISLNENNFDYLEIGSDTLSSSAFQKPKNQTFTLKGPEPKIDCIFVIDTTGSNRHNQPAISKALNHLTILLKDIDVQIGLIFQGDYCDGFKVISSYDPVSVQNVSKILSQDHDTGGGDTPEAYELGMYTSRTMTTRPDARKIIVFVTDAYPHGYHCPKDVRQKYDFDVEYALAQEDNITTHFLYTDSGIRLGRQWSKAMAARFEESQFLELKNRDNIPYTLAGIVAAEADLLDSFITNAKGIGVYNSEVEGALRVFKKRGYSERVLVSEFSGTEANILGLYTRNQPNTTKVSDIRLEKNMHSGKAFVELTASRSVKTPAYVASAHKSGKAFIRELTSPTGSVRIGPDPGGKIFLEVKNEKLKTVKNGESLLFVEL